MNKVLITGATGFIGSHIAEFFSQKNIPAVCLVRESSDISFLKKLNVEIVYGDIRDAGSVENALKNIDFVIHTAGRSTDWGKYQDFYENNVTGTLNVLQACVSSNIKNVIITGSVSSYGEENSGIIKDENSPYNSHYRYFCGKIFPSAMNFYRDTKAVLTKKSIEFAENNDLNLTMIEPVWVYGEREFNTGFYEYLKAVRQGIKFMPGNKFNKFHVIYAGDLAKAYFLAFDKKLKGINRIIVGNPVPERMNLIHSIFCRAAGLNPPALIPKLIAYPLGFIFELASAILRTAKPPLISRSRISMMYDNIGFSVEKAKMLLGFTAETSLEEGILKTVKWYKTNGFLG